VTYTNQLNHWQESKLLKGGIAIGHSVRGCTEVGFSEAKAEKLCKAQIISQHYLQSTGMALVATCHPFSVGCYHQHSDPDKIWC